MYKHYFLICFRGLLKSPLNSFINIFGLSAAIGISLLLYAFAQYTYRTDQFHKNRNEVYLATFFTNRDGSEQQFGTSPRALGELLKEDFSQIKNVCRVQDRNVIVKQMDNVFHESLRFVDPSFLEMFTFELKWGSQESLNDINSIILSEEMSLKYFGKGNSIGQTILVKFDSNHSKEFKVTGVARKFPESRSIDFNFLVHFDNLRTSEPTYDYDSWKDFVNATFIQVESPQDISVITKGMNKYKTVQNQIVDKDWAISSFAFEPLATLHQHAGAIRDDISSASDSNYKSIIFLTVISLLMLTLACVNYINIAIVSAAKRFKEIGVRKSIGAARNTVIMQFLSENIVMTFFASAIGLLLGRFVIIPWFEQINSFSTEFTLKDYELWIYMVAVLFFTAIASGIYPACYISKFQVVTILKGSVQFGKRNPVTKIFLGFQLVIACILVTSAVVFTQNSGYLEKRSWGYNQVESLYAEVPDASSYERLRAAMSQNLNVISMSGSAHHIAKSKTTTVLHLTEREYEVDQLSVDADYFNTLGLELLAGRNFNSHEGSDKQSVIVNQLLVKNMAWDNAIGKQFRIDSLQYEVIGVVKDFHSTSFRRPILPLIFRVADKQNYRYLTLKVTPGTEIETYQAMHHQWAQLYPEIPFQGSLQEDVWGNYFAQISTHGKFWRGIALIAVLLASLGLYGLMTVNVTGRAREFSIRKVLGASTRNITQSITSQYLILFIAALLIGAPVSYLLIKLVLDYAYEYHMPITFSGTAIAVSILIAILLATIFLQLRKVMQSNPVDGLKED